MGRAKKGTRHPLKKVVKVESYQAKHSTPGWLTNKFTLECGHVTRNRASAPLPTRKRCYFCPLV